MTSSATTTLSSNMSPEASTTRLSLVTGARQHRITRRERDVLVLVAEGFSTREVAKQLCYSERTIKNIVQDVTSRLALRNRTQAVAVAIREGWI